MKPGPMISCIMPHVHSVKRSELARMAHKCFSAQTYPHKELIYGVSELTPGEARNYLIRRSHGSVIAHWDDDDWFHKDRLYESISAIARGHDIVYSSSIYYRDIVNRKAYLVDGIELDWAPCGTLVYRREVWETVKFDAYALYGEEHSWSKITFPMFKVADLKNPALYVATIHEENTCKKFPGKGWKPVEYELVEEIIKNGS